MNAEKNAMRSKDPVQSKEGLIENESGRRPDPSNIKRKPTLKGAKRISVHGDHYW